MKYDDIIKYLKSYQELKYNIEFYRTKMSGLKAISYSQEEKGSVLDNLMTEYMSKIEESEHKMKEIEKFIENGFQGKERLCIWNRYINNYTYKQIGAEIYYTSSYTRKFITNAIYNYLETINK